MPFSRPGLGARQFPPKSPLPPARSPYCVGLRRAVQLYHVALQVLLLHELLGTGGALKGRRAGSASSCPPRQRFRCEERTGTRQHKGLGSAILMRNTNHR